MSPLATVTTGAGELARAGDAWKATRADQSVQFAPLQAPKPPAEPEWLKRFLEWLSDLLGPIGKAFAGSFDVIRWVLLAVAIAALLYLLWRLVGPALGWKPDRAEPSLQGHWAPNEGAAIDLLKDADRLASLGQFGAATHLLLQRSVGQIAEARPELVDPSTTARELSGMSALPAGARTAFATIAERVERSLFALSALEAEDWQAARKAYSDFALARIGG